MPNDRKKKLKCVWYGMLNRCSKPYLHNYYRYGGRGIKVEWLSFKNFFNDMNKTYKEGLQIDRTDNDGNYNKQNCRWVTPRQQSSNTRRNRFFTLNNMTKTLSQWARFLQVNRSLLSMRIYVYRWSIERALTFKIQERRKNFA